MNPETLKAILALTPSALAGLIRRKTRRAVSTSKSVLAVHRRTDGRVWPVAAYDEAWGKIFFALGGGVGAYYDVLPTAEGVPEFEVKINEGDTPRDTLTHVRNIIRLIVQTMRGDNTPEANALLNPAPSPVVALELEEAPVAHAGSELTTLTCTPSEAERLREYSTEQARLPHDPARDHATALGLTVAVFAGEYPPSEEEWGAVMGGPYPSCFIREAGKRGWAPEYGPAPQQSSAAVEGAVVRPRVYAYPSSVEAAPVGLPLDLAPEHYQEAAQSLAALMGAPEHPDLIAGLVSELEGGVGFTVTTQGEVRALLLGAAWAALEASKQAPPPKLKSGRLPYGFKRLDTGELAHCEEEREAAEEIARGRVNGESWGQIATRLNASRIPGARSGEWTRSKVRNAFRVRRAWLDAAEATRP